MESPIRLHMTTHFLCLLFKGFRLHSLRHRQQLIITLLLSSRRESRYPSEAGTCWLFRTFYEEMLLKLFCHALFHTSGFCLENPSNSCNGTNSFSVSLMALEHLLCSHRLSNNSLHPPWIFPLTNMTGRVQHFPGKNIASSYLPLHENASLTN